MFIRILQKKKLTIAFHFVVIFTVMCAVFLAITLYTQSNANLLEKSEVELNERNLIKTEKTIIADRMSGLVSDVLFMADTLLLEHPADGDYSHIEEVWIAFSNRKGIYDQIRFLDTDGNEVVRINNGMGYALAVKQSVLQNKKNRPYFQDIITLEKNQIFVSGLDLNVENGVLEQPIKPMLRIGTPFIRKGGELGGAVVLNYAANEVLMHIKSVASGSHGVIFLLNANGYWLFNGEDGSKEWAFMYEDRADESFAAAYPEEWAVISSERNGYFNTENGTFSYTSLIPRDELLYTNGVTYVLCRSGPIYIVSFISHESDAGRLLSIHIADMIPTVVVKYVFVYVLIAIFALILAVLLVVNKAQKKEIKYFAEFDTMTGVYNRRSGYAKLSAIRRDTTKKNCKISICFIDINGLKEVNDQLGHDMGDELIKSIVEVVRDSVRGNDFVARLGGDEFLIVFDDLGEEGAEKVWKRIVRRFEQINDGENRAYRISVSHGVKVFACDGKVSIDEAINQADEKMYGEKREIKKNLRVIRDRK